MRSNDSNLCYFVNIFYLCSGQKQCVDDLVRQGCLIHDFQNEWQNKWWLNHTNCRLGPEYTASTHCNIVSTSFAFVRRTNWFGVRMRRDASSVCVFVCAMCVRKMDNELILIWSIYLFLCLPRLLCSMCLQRRNYELKNKHWVRYCSCCCWCCLHRAWKKTAAFIEKLLIEINSVRVSRAEEFTGIILIWAGWHSHSPSRLPSDASRCIHFSPFESGCSLINFRSLCEWHFRNWYTHSAPPTFVFLSQNNEIPIANAEFQCERKSLVWALTTFGFRKFI